MNEHKKSAPGIESEGAVQNGHDDLTSSPPDRQSEARGIPGEEAPYIWQSKDALYRIENSSAITNHLHAKATYTALTWLASDAGNPRFIASINAVAAKASLGYRTILKILKELESIGIVVVARPKIKAPATFTICTTCRSISTGRRSIGTRKLHSRADISKEHRKKEEGAPSQSERISMEKKCAILKKRANELRQDTAESWQQRENPEKVSKLRKLEEEIVSIEQKLLAA